jgi:hypothetical protein
MITHFSQEIGVDFVYTKRLFVLGLDQRRYIGCLNIYHWLFDVLQVQEIIKQTKFSFRTRGFKNLLTKNKKSDFIL